MLNPMPTDVRSLPTGLRDLPSWLDATEGFSAVLDALGNRLAVTIDGAWHSAAALVAADLALHVPSTLLVVIPHVRDIDEWAEDMHGFSGLSSHIFPAWDSLPGPDAVADEVGGQRLRLIGRLDS